MGSCGSFCMSKDENEQYEVLVVSKPIPVSLNDIQIDSDDSEILFFPIQSDDEAVISDPETLTDTEINVYSKGL